jgi:hypothetical protein
MSDQTLPAFVAQLLNEGVSAVQITRAVSRVRDLRIGQDIAGNYRPGTEWDPEQLILRRAFSNSIASQLEKLR